MDSGFTPHYSNNSYVDKSKDKFHQLNETGLELAYKNKLTYTYIIGDTLFIGGTQNSQDVYDDVRHVPWWGNMKQTQRYRDAETHLKNNPQIKRLVGHSLGASVALALQKNNPDKYDVVTYGAPVTIGLDPFRKGKVERYKHIGKAGESDPIASLDFFANEVPINSSNPFKLHSYKGYVYDYDNHNIKPTNPKPTVIQQQITTQIPKSFNPVQTDNTYRIY